MCRRGGGSINQYYNCTVIILLCLILENVPLASIQSLSMGANQVPPLELELGVGGRPGVDIAGEVVMRHLGRASWNTAPSGPAKRAWVTPLATVREGWRG